MEMYSVPAQYLIKPEETAIREVERLRFIPQLDSFRFFAVLLVIISHWIPNNKINLIPNGLLGVTFFFVLSGYLISTNLLFQKRSIQQKKISIGHALRIFYSRRTLRIFPLYFFAILVVYLLNSAIFHGKVLWYLAYIPNFLIFKENYWPEMLSHFWSLGVEEQFYLICPLLIFCVKWERLKYFFSGLILLSLLFKLFFFTKASSDFRLYSVLPLSCFDAFGIGAILAYMTVSKDAFLAKIYGRFFLPGLILCILGAIGVYIINHQSPLFGLLVSGASFFLIAKACFGFSGFFGWVLNLRLFRYFGRISYGLYVYHNFIPWLWRCFTSQEDKYFISVQGLKIPWLTKPGVALSAEFLLLILISTASWFLIEKRFIDLKRFIR